MANLDVALRLRLINGIRPGAQDARRDLDALKGSALALNRVRGGEALARDLGRVATTGNKADAALRQIGADRARIAGTAAVAAELARNLERAGSAAARIKVPQASTSSGRGARTINRDVDNLRALARPSSRVPLSRGPSADVRRERNEALAAAGLSRYGAAGAAAGTVFGTGKAYVAFADVERRMTRIGITAEATREEMRGVTREAQDLAIKFGLSFDKVAAGYEALATQGRKMAEIRTFMPAVAATAQASGADVADIANSAGAIGEQMGIAAPRMQAAFDILVAGGKAGKFELKDMARYLPSLAPLASAVGLKGEEGLRRLVAIAQVVRNQTGTAEEAAASLNNIFAKMESKETAKNFKDMGVDLEEAMAKARKEGRDLITVFAELADKAIGGDLSKLPKLIADMEFSRGIRALLSQKGAVDKFVESFRKVDGTTVADLNRVLGDTRANVDRLSSSWERFTTQLGATVAPAISPILDATTKALRLASDVGEDFGKRPIPAGRMLSNEGQSKLNRLLNAQSYGDESSDAEVVARARSGWHDAQAQRRKAEITAEIALKDAQVRQMEAIQPGPFGASPKHRELIEGTKARVEGLRAQMVAIDKAAAEIDASLAAYDTFKAVRARFGAVRIRQGRDGFDPSAEGDASGGTNFFPAPGQERPRFTMGGIPQGPDQFPLPAPAPQPAPAKRDLDRLEDVLNDRPDRFSLDRGGAARPGMEAAMAALAGRMRAVEARAISPSFGLGGPAAPAGTGPAGTLPRSGTAAFPLAADLAKARFDPQPIVIGVRQAEDAAKGLQTSLQQDLSAPATESMRTYTAALQTGLDAAVATVVAQAARMQAALSFTATPTISPSFTRPSANAVAGPAPAGARSAPASLAPRMQTASRGRGGATFTGPIHVHGVRDVASLERSIRREADRRARDARDDALHDTGTEVT